MDCDVFLSTILFAIPLQYPYHTATGGHGHLAFGTANVKNFCPSCDRKGFFFVLRNRIDCLHKSLDELGVKHRRN